ncbi:MAG: hypothetical protein KDJ35_06000 [Alphaproteobacteria bacterium]|nr:hypothetical protein [Alphaproteobacteria bacterium]
MINEIQKYETKKGMATIEICTKFNELRGDHLWIKFSKAAEKNSIQNTRYVCTVVVTVDDNRPDRTRRTIFLKQSHEAACLKIPLVANRDYSVWVNAQKYYAKRGKKVSKIDEFEKPITCKFSTHGEDIRAGARTKREIVYINAQKPVP